LLSQYGNVTFQYDGEGFRRKKVNGSNTSIYYYENGRLLCEERISGSNRNKLYFVYSNGENVGYLYDATLYYFRKNALGDVVALYDSEGTCVATYKYDAWGNCTIGTNVDGLADLNPIRYRGYYYDKETQLYYLQTRYYDPQTGRFISPDTVNYLDPESIHGLNLYAYCFNNPVMGYDPTGHWDWGQFWRTVGVVALAGVAIAAVAAVTAATGGSAVPVFMGAGWGAFTSAVTSIAVQGTTTGTVDWYQVAVDAAAVRLWVLLVDLILALLARQ
jgi:RHS repeat-associated protein